MEWSCQQLYPGNPAWVARREREFVEVAPVIMQISITDSLFCLAEVSSRVDTTCHCTPLSPCQHMKAMSAMPEQGKKTPSIQSIQGTLATAEIMIYSVFPLFSWHHGKCITVFMAFRGVWPTHAKRCRGQQKRSWPQSLREKESFTCVCNNLVIWKIILR